MADRDDDGGASDDDDCAGDGADDHLVPQQAGLGSTTNCPTTSRPHSFTRLRSIPLRFQIYKRLVSGGPGTHKVQFMIIVIMVPTAAVCPGQGREDLNHDHTSL